MNAHQKLERELRESVAMRRRGRRHGRPRLLTVIPVVVTLAVVAVVVVVLASRSSGPSGVGPAAATNTTDVRPGSPIASREVNRRAITAADDAVAARQYACSLVPNRPPVISEGTPALALRLFVPALIRGDTTALPAELRRVSQPPGLGPIYVRYVRRAQVVDGISFWLVPVADEGHAAISVSTARACQRAEVAALRARLPGLPAAQRGPTQLEGDGEFASQNEALEQSTLHDGLFLWTVGRDGRGDSSVGGKDSLEIQRGGFAGSVAGSGSERLIDGVVPVGVAGVRLTFGATGASSGPLISCSGAVINDVFVIRGAPSAASGERLYAMQWLSASGRVIKTINEVASHS